MDLTGQNQHWIRGGAQRSRSISPSLKKDLMKSLMDSASVATFLKHEINVIEGGPRVFTVALK